MRAPRGRLDALDMVDREGERATANRLREFAAGSLPIVSPLVRQLPPGGKPPSATRCYPPRRWSRRTYASPINSERRKRRRRPRCRQGIVPLAAALRSAASVIPRRSAASVASISRSAKDAFAISSRTIVRISCKTEATIRGSERTRVITASTTRVKAWSSCVPDETQRSCGTGRGEGEDCRKRMPEF